MRVVRNALISAWTVTVRKDQLPHYVCVCLWVCVASALARRLNKSGSEECDPEKARAEFAQSQRERENREI